jgi:uncharacterized protein YbbC (DUF1343 family)
MICPTALAAGPAGKPSVLTGIDVLEQEDFASLRGRRIGLITNPTGVTHDLRSTVDVLHNAKPVMLVALFGPEHGIRGDVYGGDKVTDGTDPVTGLPEHSLYGATRKPTPRSLERLDVLVYDIQDVGCRSYTFISTMAKAMEAAAENNVEFVVLDRPNPLTGNRIEGNILDPEFKSFIGLFEIPYVYGLTCGELATLLNEEGRLGNGVKCKLRVIKMKGWRRDMWFDDTGLPWVATSPHVPNWQTSMFYVATGIMGELHVISEGVGYPLPFQLAGAPWISSTMLAETLNGRRLPGVYFRPMTFKPYYGPHGGTRCGGVQVHITDRDRVNLVGIQFHVMDVHQKLYSNHPLFESRRTSMFDKACGTDTVRKMFKEGKSATDVLKAWDTGAAAFRELHAKYQLYK